LVALLAWLRPASGFEPDWQAILVGAILIGILVNYPIPVDVEEVSVAHTVGLMLGLANGPGLMGISLATGLMAGELVRGFWKRAPVPRQGTRGERTRASLLGWSAQALSLFGSLNAYQILGGRWASEPVGLPSPLPGLVASLIFVALFVAFHWLNHYLTNTTPFATRSFAVFALITFVPLPFAMVGAQAFAQFGVGALVVLGGVPAIIAPILRGFLVAEADRARRLQETAALSQVSQVIRMSLDLDSILDSIYQHISSMLACNRFYVALVDPETERLTFPLAIRDGVREEWVPRPLTDSLAERVIRPSRPRRFEADELRSTPLGELIGLGLLPSAWIGAPLVSRGSTLGCIALYHTLPGARFDEGDLESLTVLAGQAGAAINHALLFEQTRARAEALASLAQITASMSSTLDPEAALDLVTESLIRVGGGQKAAIFLLEEENQQLALARSLNLTPEFVRASTTIRLEQLDRLLAFHARQPVLISDLTVAEHSPDLQRLLEQEGVRAYADFPLITPEGMIGQVSVYFTRPQRFPSSQVELLKTFAAQAAIAVANSRAHAATDKALQKRVDQLSALEAIGREMTSTLEPGTLASAILHHALRITNAHLGHVAVSEPAEEGFRIVAHTGYPESSPANRTDCLYPSARGITGRTLTTGKTWNIRELQPVPGQLDWSGGRSRSVLSVPILRQGRCLGVITLESERLAAFTDEDERLVAQLAAQAAVALTNAALYQQVQARLREQSLLYQASAQIAGTLESEGVALAAADSLAVALSADMAILSRWDGQTGLLYVLAAIEGGRPMPASAVQSLSLAETPALQRCLEGGEPLQYTLETAPSPQDAHYLQIHRRATSLLAAPIVLGAQRIGLLEVLSKVPRAFDENEIRTALTIVSQAAIGLQNAYLFRRISESHDRLMAILNSTLEGMLMVDTFGRVLLANSQLEMLTGLHVDRLVGRVLTEPELRASKALGYRASELENLVSGLQFGKGSPVGPTAFETAAPSHRMLERTETPVCDAEGMPIGWLIALRDATEERKLESVRSQLTEMIVHDLRSPLTAILSSLRLLDSMASAAPSPVAAQALSVSRRSCQQMLGLVSSLLDIAKLERGEMELSLTPVDLRGLCEEIAEQYTHEANEVGVILTWECCPSIPRLSADAEKLGRILANLLDNALKFTPAGGSVDLRIDPDDGGVLISVSDSGPGIPEEYREGIFERFTQVPGTEGRRRGTGLGLAFAKLAVEAHGGRIWVENGTREGSCFRIKLPLAPPDASPRP
jgi:PAS domain S-box-containing protein